MGYLRGVLRGAVLEAATALLYTPQRGKEMRELLSRRVAAARTLTSSSAKLGLPPVRQRIDREP